MDRQHFDDLARALAAGSATRRNALRILTGGALASVGVTSLTDAAGKAKDGGQVKQQGSGGQKNGTCIPLGRQCRRKTKKGSASEKQNSKRCCGSVTILDGKFGRCCNHNGLPCGATVQCCLGVCTNGTCQNDVFVLPPPPPPPPVCVATGQPCPAGCNPDEACAGCCQGLCNEDGNCELNF